MLVAESCCGAVFQQQGLGDKSGLRGNINGAMYNGRKRDPWWKPSPECSGPDWGECSPSNRTANLSTKSRQSRSGFGTSAWMSLYCPTRARIWTASDISGETWKKWKEWEKLPRYSCASL
jgi:hypothetical protein